MSVLKLADFKKIAHKIAEQYVANGKPLDESLVAVAQAHKLTPNQLQTLLNAVNSLTHLILLKAKDDNAATDRIIEFEPADFETVIARVYAHGTNNTNTDADNTPAAITTVSLPAGLSGANSCDPCGTDAADELEELQDLHDYSRVEDMFSDLPNLMHILKKRVASEPGRVADKTVAAPHDNSVTHVSTRVSPHMRSIAITKIKKVAEELEVQRTRAALTYKDNMDSLAADFARLYGPDLDTFEKNAFALYAGAALPVLNDIRDCLRLPPLQTGVKTAGQKPTIVDTDDPQLCKLGTMLKNKNTYQDCDRTLRFIAHKLN